MDHFTDMHIDHLLTRAILDAQSRHEDEIGAAERAAKAYAAGLEAFRAAAIKHAGTCGGAGCAGGCTAATSV
ncbi:MAG: hypothetical protein V4641_01790 [Pseudomonadota bacterium]